MSRDSCADIASIQKLAGALICVVCDLCNRLLSLGTVYIFSRVSLHHGHLFDRDVLHCDVLVDHWELSRLDWLAWTT